MSVPAAPVLRPTYEEWHDFAAYVRQITPLIERFGGCQVIPPPEWKHQSVPPLSTGLETKTKITPIRQHVHGKNGKFQSVMEWCDPQPLDNFIADAVAADATIAGLEPEDLDAKFWRFVAAPPASLYGSDSSEAGSLFDPELKEWNLGALPGGVDHDLTQSLPMAIPGLNRSMLYFGRWRSFFALHTEDCELQGASYLHWGAPKRWYVVPPSHAERVRSLAATSFPELKSACSNFVRHKTTLLSPQALKASNIPCFSVLQEVNTFVIVLASAFHFGYNLGANCAEAVNFGLTSWLPKGLTATPCTCDGHQTPHIEVPYLMRTVKQQYPRRRRIGGSSNADVVRRRRALMRRSLRVSSLNAMDVGIGGTSSAMQSIGVGSQRRRRKVVKPQLRTRRCTASSAWILGAAVSMHQRRGTSPVYAVGMRGHLTRRLVRMGVTRQLAVCLRAMDAVSGRIPNALRSIVVWMMRYCQRRCGVIDAVITASRRRSLSRYEERR